MSKIGEKIDEANKIGSLLNSWTKIIVVYGGALISCTLAYYKIFQNEKDIQLEKKERIEQFSNSQDRGDKRYDRMIESTKELKDFLKYHENRILELEKQQSYDEGYNKGKENNSK